MQFFAFETHAKIHSMLVNGDSCENWNVCACLDWRVFSAADLTPFSVALFHVLYFTIACLPLPFFLCCKSTFLCLVQF